MLIQYIKQTFSKIYCISWCWINKVQNM